MSGGIRFGCSHYERRAKFVAECCKKSYFCRFCHDEQEVHEVNRKAIRFLICTNCDEQQGVSPHCLKCGIAFGEYCCLKCRLFDRRKDQFHCDGCGICRVGGRNNFFHCPKCNMCLPISIRGEHTKCVENMSHTPCPICLEDLHTSRTPCHIPQCGHLLHQHCFQKLLDFGHFICPTCKVSIMGMAALWKHLDKEILQTPMPPDYIGYNVVILCQDCHKVSSVPFHVIGFKCTDCGSYNTCRIENSQASCL